MALLLFIDFEKNTIHTVRNVVFLRGMNDPVVGMPKTDSGTRYVPIAPERIKVFQPIGAHRCIIGARICKLSPTDASAEGKKKAGSGAQCK